MPRQCRDRDLVIKLRARIDADLKEDTVWFGTCTTGQYGPIVKLTSTQSWIVPSDTAVLRGYGLPFQVVVLEEGDAPVFGIVRLMGVTGAAANIDIYVTNQRDQTTELAWSSDDSVYDGYWEWCDFEAASYPDFGFIVTEVDPFSYEYEYNRCEVGYLYYTAYLWETPNDVTPWPEPAEWPWWVIK